MNPQETKAIAELDQKRAALTEKLRVIMGQMIPHVPMIARIVQTGQAVTQQEQQLAGIAIDFALNVLALALLIGAMEALEVVSSCARADITKPPEVGDDHCKD